MKDNRFINNERGITLIALVITIIVLLILAGVAISMLSGENGILRKAAEAKTKTAEGQKQEETALASMELETYFQTENKKYKCSNGYITGIEFDFEQDKSVDSVKQFEDKLPNGYKITKKYNFRTEEEELVNDTDTLATGMVVEKDQQEVARIIIFGDINCDGEVTGYDKAIISRYVNKLELLPYGNLKDFQKVACCIDDNNEINGMDINIIERYLVKWQGYKSINQNKSVIYTAKDIKRCYSILQNYIGNLDKSTGYSFKYNNETDTYILNGVQKDTTVENLIKVLPNSDQLSILDKDGEEVANDQNVLDGYYIKRSFTEDEYDYNLVVASIEVK